MLCQLRRAEQSQAIALTNIMHEAKGYWGYDAEDMKLFCEHWKINPGMIEKDQIFSITKDGTPLGFVRIVKEEENVARLDCLFVLPSAHGKGYGSWLLEGAEEIVKQMQCDRIRLESDANAAPFYAHHGYITTSSRPSAFKNAGNIQHMEKQLAPKVQRVSNVSIKLNSSAQWSFAEHNRQAIQENWQKRVASNPALWDGKVFSLYDYSFEDGNFAATVLETDYSAFLSWLDWGFPDRTAKNLFGTALLQSSEGYLVFGKMAGNTATAGQVYSPGGNLDLNDLKDDGTVDVLGSIARELEEETGFKMSDGKLGDLFFVDDGPRLAIARVLTLPLTAAQIRAKIEYFNANLENPELEEAVIISSPADLSPYDVPPHARALAVHLLN